MTIGKVDVTLRSGGLGIAGGTDDGITGMTIGCDVGTSGITAGDIFVLTSLDDAVTNKISEIPYAYQQVQEFYNESGRGAKLYVQIVEDTETLTEICDKASTNKYAKTLLDYADGEINIFGACRLPDSGYTPTVTNGIDIDSENAVVKLQVLAGDKQDEFAPIVGIVEARSFNGVPNDLTDFSQASNNYVGLAIAASDELNTIDSESASVGLLLGRAAANPVQRKISRVKDGALSITGAYYGSSTVENTDFTSIDAKGFITIGTYIGKTGYYFMDDLLATSSTDDYKVIVNRRVMNKVVRIVYKTYVEELNDDIEITSEGQIESSVAKYYEGLIKTQLQVQMQGNSEISDFSVNVDPAQNVLSTGKIEIELSIIPKGYAQEISVVIGFDNPAA